MMRNINSLARECKHRKLRGLMRTHAWKIARSSSEIRQDTISARLQASLALTGDAPCLLKVSAQQASKSAKSLQSLNNDNVQPAKDVSSLKAGASPGRDLLGEDLRASELSQVEGASKKIEPLKERAPAILADISDVELLEALLMVKIRRATNLDNFETIGCTAQAAKRDRSRPGPQSKNEEKDDGKARDE